MRLLILFMGWSVLILLIRPLALVGLMILAGVWLVSLPWRLGRVALGQGSHRFAWA